MAPGQSYSILASLGHRQPTATEGNVIALVNTRIPVDSTAKHILYILEQNGLLREERLGMVEKQHLTEIGIPLTDAEFILLDKASWDALELIWRKLSTCSHPKCMTCDGCRVRSAIYVYRVHSAQALLSSLENMHILTLGIKAEIRLLQSKKTDPKNLELQLFASPEGYAICISCNTECITDIFCCLGCSARCHLSCWRKGRHIEFSEFVFVCLLCRAQKPDLNQRVQLKQQELRNFIPGKYQRCLECGADPSKNECAGISLPQQLGRPWI